MSQPFNTKEEAQELSDARGLIAAGTYSHIAGWIYAECKCSKYLTVSPSCAECKRRSNILRRANRERRLDGLARELSDYGYVVTKPEVQMEPCGTSHPDRPCPNDAH